jgi:hypothetical protein
MIIFIFYIIATFFLGILFLCPRQFGNKNRKLYVFLIGSMVFLISALRSDHVGTDIPGYISTFRVINIASFADILTKDKDQGFYILIKLLSFINKDPHFYLAVIAAIFAISISWFIYRYSSEPAFSFFALLPLNFFYFSMTGLRQTLAMSVLLFAFPYILNRKPLQFFLIIILASTFHKTAVLFSLAYLGNYFKLNYKSVVAMICCFVAAYVFRHTIVGIAVSAAPERNMEITNAGGGITTLVMYACIFSFCTFFRKNIQNTKFNYSIMYYFLMLGMIFQAMTPVLNEFFRFAMYFNIYVIILLPKIISSMRDKHLRSLCYISAIAVLGAMYVLFTYKDAGILPYSFFWNA